jgi:hypothetical protein
MKGHIAYRGFQEPWNRRLAGGVEPLGVAALLTPTDGVGDGLEPTIAAPLSVFFVASSKAFFFVVASSSAFLFAASSSAAFFATAASLTAIFLTAASSVTFFFTTSSTTFFFPVASSTPTSAASFDAAALVAEAASPTIVLPLDPLGVVAYATADEAGLDAGAAGGCPPVVDLPWPHALILLCSGITSSDETSLSL